MQVRNPKRFYWFEWVFLVVATLSMLAVIGISIQRFVYFSDTVEYIRFPNTSNQTSNGSLDDAPCDSWVCTSDFIFAVALLVNLGKCLITCSLIYMWWIYSLVSRFIII